MAVKAESDEKAELRISEEEVMAQASSVFPSRITSAYYQVVFADEDPHNCRL